MESFESMSATAISREGDSQQDEKSDLEDVKEEKSDMAVREMYDHVFNPLVQKGGNWRYGNKIKFAIKLPKKDKRIDFWEEKPKDRTMHNDDRFFDWLLVTCYNKTRDSDITDRNQFLKTHLPVIAYGEPHTSKIRLINSVACVERLLELSVENSEKFPEISCTWIPCAEDFPLQWKDRNERSFAQKTLGGAGSLIALLGETGVGKSTFMNTILGFHPFNGPCQTSNSVDSCTKDVKSISGAPFGSAKEKYSLITMIDTPGFSDSDTMDDELTEKVLDFLRAMRFGPNLLALCIDSGNPRIAGHQKEVIRFLAKAFGSGQNLAKHLVIVFTKCDPQRKNGTFGWGNTMPSRKKEYLKKVQTILYEHELEVAERRGETRRMEQLKSQRDTFKPINVIPVSCEDSQSLRNLLDLAEKTGRMDSRDIKRYKDIEREEGKELVNKLLKELAELRQEKARLNTRVKKFGKEKKKLENRVEELEKQWRCILM